MKNKMPPIKKITSIVLAVSGIVIIFLVLFSICSVVLISMVEELVPLEGEEYSDIPIEFYQEGEISTNIDLVIENSTQIIKKWLPDAKFQSISYVGSCQNARNLQGKFVIVYLQIKIVPFNLNQRILRASVFIDVSSNTAYISILDHSNNSQTVNFFLKRPTHDHFLQIIETARQHARCSGESLFYISQEKRTGNHWVWEVSYETGEGDNQEYFEIDDSTLKITDRVSLE